MKPTDGQSNETSLIEAEIIAENESIDNQGTKPNDDWKHDKWILLLVFLLILIAGYLVFPTSTQPVPGAYCTVQFRRDLLGANANGPISPLLSAKHNGTDLSVHGKLVSIDKLGVILQVEQYDDDKKIVRNIWIPLSSILLIEQHKKKIS